MKDEILYMPGVVAVGFAVTYALRALPFLLFAGRSRSLPPWVERFGNLISPVIIAAIDYTSRTCFDYRFGYELLMLNALLTIAGMMLISNNKNKRKI